MSDNIKIKKYYKLKSRFSDIQQINEELSLDTIQNFDKIKEKEIEPTIQNIHENIFEEDLSIVIDNLVNFYFKEINEGKDYNLRQQHILNYLNEHKINLQEINNWLLNNQNDSNSIYLLGYFNCNGIGIDVNKQKAFKLYEKAVELENKAAQFDFAIMHMQGKVVGKNHDKTFELSKKLAEKEYPGGITLLGHCYDKGIGTDTNLQKAFELYQKSADLGNICGINNLGCYYNHGVGTDINKQKAVELYQKAADSGYNIAQYNLALMYENGNGIKKDIIKAIYWYKKSAKQNYTNAQNKLKELLNE
ncbi:hypothetical protein RclHR1_09520009 [Rhizophagus clarus]|uniref:Kinase-like domain-containing protein n=1 Tax=Rhizophagus clarus TaxID=94130 RepID=A0A2Z6S4R3_9GLOM|nr:hypothetical protein RclHR1_09520009 [Rhizophagus clarus]GES91067.1 kinase-like domain-containing protein [Rhizophagus clarus]